MLSKRFLHGARHVSAFLLSCLVRESGRVFFLGATSLHRDTCSPTRSSLTKKQGCCWQGARSLALITAADPTCLKRRQQQTQLFIPSLKNTRAQQREAAGENITQVADPAAGGEELPLLGFDFPKPAPEGGPVHFLLT